MATTASAVNRVVVRAPGDFDAALAAALAAPAPTRVFAYFTGEKDASTGVSWCPDCVDAAPIVDAVLAEAAAAGPITLLECPVARSEYRGVPTHPYRVHGGIKLARIPTLMRWGKKAKTGELVEDACKDADAVRELVGE
jgi:hypothetical protein